MDWKENFAEGKELVLSTASKDGKPNANIVMSLGFVDNKLLIADSQMHSTIKNLEETKQACIVNGYLRINGSVEVFSEGKYVDLCNEKDKEYPTKHAILVTVKEVFNLDKVEKIEL